VSLAAWRGLDFLSHTLRQLTELPDLVAIKFIVPALVEEIEDTLAVLKDIISKLRLADFNYEADNLDTQLLS
jgi:hypothetical protein